MKKIMLALALPAIMATNALYAQITLPQPSPHCVTKQTVGLTDITVDYSRPGVKGRTAFGDVVPFDKLWRTGANGATVLEFSDDVMINGQKLPKGRYALFTIPGKTEWTIIINKNPNQSNVDQYKQEEDAMRVKVKPHATSFTESLTIDIDSIRNNSAQLDLKWERTAVSLPITVPTDEKVMDNITKTTDNAWSIYSRSAQYMVDNNGDMNKAMDMVNKSISLKETYSNRWIRSQIEAKQGNYTAAAADAEKAVELGKAEGKDSNYRFFSERVEKNAKEYREKAGPAKAEKKKKK